MATYRLQKTVDKLFHQANININGTNPWDIKVHDNRFYHRILSDSELGLGESFMDSWWDCDEIDTMVFKIFRAGLHNAVKKNFSLLYLKLISTFFNRQRAKQSFKVGRVHYDLGNGLFQQMLDPYMNYSCGYWRDAKSLEQAQINKLDLICRKLELQKGMRVLDIGCGWGAFGRYAAENYGVSVVGVTISNQQVLLGKKLCEGLPVEFRFSDYRQLDEQFDRIVSVGMFEHVGYKNYRTFMQVAQKCLKPNGLFLLHTIGKVRSVTSIDPWIEKYIFPNSMIPSIKQIGQSIENLFVMEDWHSFGPDYDKTLLAWYKNFNNNWESLKTKYNKRFYRMWKYYLLSSAGSFRARYNHLWQIVLSKEGRVNGYIVHR